jgi:hypothetical protein
MNLGAQTRTIGRAIRATPSAIPQHSRSADGFGRVEKEFQEYIPILSMNTVCRGEFMPTLASEILRGPPSRFSKRAKSSDPGRALQHVV